MNYRCVTSEDHFLLGIWWEANGWPKLPAHLMSDFGLMIEEDGVPLAAGWLYLTTSKWAWLEFIVANPTAPLKDRAKAVDYLVERLVEESKGFGATAIFSSVARRSLVKLYEKHGFRVGDQNMTNMVMNLCQPQQ